MIAIAIAPLLDELEAAVARRERVYAKIPSWHGVDEFRQELILAKERVVAARRALEALIASQESQK
jgi:hypothetical protein